jgi:hypothetical protein
MDGTPDEPVLTEGWAYNCLLVGMSDGGDKSVDVDSVKDVDDTVEARISTVVVVVSKPTTVLVTGSIKPGTEAGVADWGENVLDGPGVASVGSVFRNNKLVTRNMPGVEKVAAVSVGTEKVWVSGNRSVVEEWATSVWTENADVVVVDCVVDVVVSVWPNGELATGSCSTIVVLDWIRFSYQNTSVTELMETVYCLALQKKVTIKFVFCPFASELNHEPWESDVVLYVVASVVAVTALVAELDW